MDNYCFFRLLDDGLPSYFSYLYPKKNGNDIAGYDFRHSGIQKPVSK